MTRHQYGISAVVLRCHFAEKPVVASRNVICLLRLAKDLRHSNQVFTETATQGDLQGDLQDMKNKPGSIVYLVILLQTLYLRTYYLQI